MDESTIDQIKAYIETGEWDELLPSYQRGCVKVLILEIERLHHLTTKSSERDEIEAQADAYREAEAKHHKLSDFDGT